jgi:hypothetical protein
MYNRQVLVDYYNGKRRIDDPELQREFVLLKEQARIDWEAMYAGKDTRVTVESIVEDYIYNAKSIAETQITARKTTRVIFLSLVGPLILSLIGPIYYGYINGPYWRVVVWALVCTVGCCWLTRSSFKVALSAENSPRSFFGRSTLVIAIIAVIALSFIAGDSVAYVLARSILH